MLRRLVAVTIALSAAVVLPTASVSATEPHTTSATYVALGDSYSSGEGNPASKAPYWLDTSGKPWASDDGCHRSAAAYPMLTAKAEGTLGSTSFVACSGDVTGSTYDKSSFQGNGGSLLSGNQGTTHEPSELNALSASTTTASITIGGNDTGFAVVLKDCMGIMDQLGALKKVFPSILGSPASCSADLKQSQKLLGTGSATSPIGKALVDTYNQVLTHAPNANLYVLSYPQLFTTAKVTTFCPVTGGTNFGVLSGGSTVYLGVTPAQVTSFNSLEALLNTTIKAAVASVNKSSGKSRVILVDVNPSTVTKAQTCDTKTMGSSVINSLLFSPGVGMTNIGNACFKHSVLPHCNGLIDNFIASGSFHPKATGQVLMASALEASIKAHVVPMPLANVKTVVSGGDGYCALLTTGAVDCWGYGYFGNLGNGQFDDSAIPVSVVSTSGSGTLTGVASLTGGDDGYCALLTSGAVDCWGYGSHGNLGNGQFYTSGNQGSAVPVVVKSTSGSGTLTGVASLTSTADSYGSGYCALLTSGAVDCWGYGSYGQFDYSAVPVSVVSTSGSGTLTGVASLTSDGAGYCALLTSGAVDCWGGGYYGQLGNGQFYTSGNQGSAVPVVVKST